MHLFYRRRHRPGAAPPAFYVRWRSYAALAVFAAVRGDWLSAIAVVMVA
jgi:hypothetical protein